MPAASTGLVDQNNDSKRRGDRGKPTRPGTLERLTVNLTPRSAQALELATELTGDSKTDAINRAIQLYAYVQTILVNGGSLHAQKSEDSAMTELLFI